jgi:hypothetical protein
MTDATVLIAQHSECSLQVDLSGVYDWKDHEPPPGTRIVQSRGHSLGLQNTRFRVEHLGSESYRVVSEYSDMVFDVAGASRASGVLIILWPWHGGPNQRFRLKQPPQLSNKVWGLSLVAEHSGKVLDVLGANIGTGADAELVQWDYHGGPNQLFRIFGSPIKPMHSDLVLDCT